MTTSTLRPGSQLGVYPQRPERGVGRLERSLEALAGKLRDANSRRRYSLSQVEKLFGAECKAMEQRSLGSYSTAIWQKWIPGKAKA